MLQDVAYGPEWAAEMKKFDEFLAVWMPAQLEKIVEGFQGEQHKLPSKYYNLEFLILVAASDEPAKLDFLRKKVKCLPRNPCSMAIRSKLPKSTRRVEIRDAI